MDFAQDEIKAILAPNDIRKRKHPCDFLGTREERQRIQQTGLLLTWPSLCDENFAMSNKFCQLATNFHEDFRVGPDHLVCRSRPMTHNMSTSTPSWTSNTDSILAIPSFAYRIGGPVAF